MSHKVTLELIEPHARVLRSMASLGRWSDSLLRLIDKIAEGEVVTQEMEQMSIEAEEDIQQLKDALNSVHMQIREQLVAQDVKPLWDQNQK